MSRSWMCLQVAFHIEPYKGRDEVNMFTNVKYVIEKWVLPCFHRAVSQMLAMWLHSFFRYSLYK